VLLSIYSWVGVFWLLIAIMGLRVEKAVIRIGCSRNQFTKDIAAELSMLYPEFAEFKLLGEGLQND
jgi:hypothetical protein